MPTPSQPVGIGLSRSEANADRPVVLVGDKGGRSGPGWDPTTHGALMCTGRGPWPADRRRLSSERIPRPDTIGEDRITHSEK
jgi:hypothetical protein